MSKKNIILIITIIILFIGASIAIYFFTKENRELNITGTVLLSGDGYIMLETKEGDYIINNIKNSYESGDEITITYKKNSLKDSTNPKEVTALKETLIKENNIKNLEENNTSPEDENITTNKDEVTETKPNDKNQETVPIENKNNNENNNITNKSADEEVLEYVNAIQSDTNNGLTSSLKSGFITIVDFLFYNGSIAGHTFNELTTTAKLEVLSIALYLDNKIDSIFPGYKESISNEANKVYTSIKNLIVSTYLDITTSICSKDSDLCESAKSNFQDLKTNFGLTWDLIKNLASSGLDKLANWYEIWSGK